MVYLGKCSWLYVGKTHKELRRSILEHIRDIEHAHDTPIARHMREAHSENLYAITFTMIEVVKTTELKGDFDKRLLLKETAWIYHLKT